MHTSNLHSVIVPGVGGSEAEHWQSWLQQVLPDTSRVQQQWQQPILPIWAENWKNHVQAIQRPMQIIAHSFGCLTTLYALH
ncbi:MAG: alpha/beta hydrolase, partial [Acinetobacter sp.]|nr:alpha/beta hydrolase [Acinetobacter sp.]